MSQEGASNVNVDDLRDLKDRMKFIVEADPRQYHNEYSLKRYLRAFKTTDNAFQVSSSILLSLITSFISVSFAGYP